jgi:hypothetical protein
MMMRILFLIVVIFVSNIIGQTTVELLPEKDNTLFQDPEGTSSNGAGEYLFTGNTNNGQVRRALVQFNLRVIPEDAQIQSAALSLTMNKTVAGPTPVTVHRVSRDWGEGASDAAGEEGRGTSAAENDATWIHAFFNTTAWDTPGGDYISTPSATDTVDGNGTYTWESTAPLVTDVQSWVDDPNSNHGWIIIGDESVIRTAKRFFSKESADTTRFPRLIVTYTPGTSVKSRDSKTIKEYRLFANYPNPFNPETTLSFQIPERTRIRLSVYDVLGKTVNVLVEKELQAGTHSVQWQGIDKNGRAVPSGLYYYRLETESFSAVKKMLFLK